MKLISCHIDAFGKFKNIDFDFQNSTVICEKNGFGKTTLAQFIKAMFYSLPSSSKRASFKSERDLYRPFDFDGRFGGKLKFECNKGTFVVLRTFGTTPTLDRFALYDAETNLPSTAFSTNLGEELFGVGRDTFENSTFFGQKNLTSGINDDIRASLATGVLSGDDVDNFQKAQEKIAKKIKELKSDAKDLKLDQLQQESERLLAKEEVLKIKLKGVDEDVLEYETLRKNTQGLSKKVDEKDVANYVSQKISIESVLQNDIARLEEKQQQKIQLEAKSKLSNEEGAFLKNESVHKAKKMQFCYGLALVFALLGFCGLIVGGIIKNNIILTVCAIVTLVSICLFIVFLFASRKYSDDYKRYQQILKNHKLTHKDLQEELGKYLQVEGDLRFVDEEIKVINLNIKKNQQSLDVLQKQFELKYGCKIDDFYIHKDENEDKINAIERKLVELATDRKHYVQDLDILQERKFELSEELTEKQEKYNEVFKKIDILTKTSSYLDKSKDNLSKRFIDPVTSRFNKYYKKFLNNGDEIVIDSNLGLKFGEHFSDVEHLSAGLFDLVYICKRFALVDLLYKKEKPVLILDDPFANFDDEKIAVAKQILKDLSDEYQIVLFTCQKARA